MKCIPTLALSTFFFASAAFAQAPVFTTLNTDGKNIFAGVKSEQKGSEPETYLLEVSIDNLTSQKIPLPIELIHREIVGLFPAENGMLVVLTQRTVEQGDKPLFHSFNPAKKEWKKLAEVECVSFAKMKIEASSVTFNCSETNKAGEEIETPKKVTLKGIELKVAGDVTLPLMKVNKENLKAELLGEAFEWKELKVGANHKEKTFTP